MNDFYDGLEARDPALREQALMAALPGQIRHAKASTTAFAELFAGIDAASISSRQALAGLPVTRKYLRTRGAGGRLLADGPGDFRCRSAHG